MTTPFIPRIVILATLLISLVVPLESALAQSPLQSPGDYDQTLEFGGRERTYHVHVPGGTAPTNGLPVLIALHGGGGNGEIMERKTDFSNLADQQGFIAVYPDGSGRFGKALTWDAHNCCGYAYNQQIDDVGFISAVIDQLIADFDVDPTRIYLTGHSNGAMMTFRLACELSDKIAAAAPYAGALNIDDCPASEPVPMLIMNADGDENVPVAGGSGSGVDDTRIDRPTSYAVDTWVGIDGCDPTPAVEDTPAALTVTYRQCASGSVVEQILIHGWSHKWPRSQDGAPLDASEVIWEFVSQFTKPSMAP